MWVSCEIVIPAWQRSRFISSSVADSSLVLGLLALSPIQPSSKSRCSCMATQAIWLCEVYCSTAILLLGSLPERRCLLACLPAFSFLFFLQSRELTMASACTQMALRSKAPRVTTPCAGAHLASHNMESLSCYFSRLCHHS